MKRRLEPLRKLVLFTKEKYNFTIPPEHMEILGLVWLADFLGMDDFLDVAAWWLDVSINAILNQNCVKCIPTHPGTVPSEHSILFSAPASCTPQEKGDLPRFPCCNLQVHPECLPVAPQCINCYKMFRVLPCVVYCQPI